MSAKSPSSCLACGCTNLIEVYRLSPCPLTDIYLRELTASLALESYPLTVKYCLHCFHLQLDNLVDPELSYSSYKYQSSVTIDLNQNFLEYARLITSSQGGKCQILDVGSNDGSFLKAAQSEGHTAYGVEPNQSLSSFANNNGLPTVNSYFDNTIKARLKAKSFPDQYDVITFNNVIANIGRPAEILSLATSLLKPKGQIVIQTGYHPLQFQRGLFDYTYHEHYSYFTLSSLQQLGLRAGLKLNSHQISDLRGGTVRVFLSKSKDCKPQSLPPEEFNTVTSFVRLRHQISASRSYINQYMALLQAQCYSVYGYGASHSTGILVHDFNLKDTFSGIVDDNCIKHGLYMPGTSYKVQPVDALLSADPSSTAVVILAWQYYSHIYNKLRKAGFTGLIIKPTLA